MDKYQKLKAVQGLIISLDEQIYRLDQKNDIGNDIYDTVTNKYYDSILEFLQKPEKVKKEQSIKSYVIYINSVAFSYIEDSINWDQVVSLANLDLTGNEILSITYKYSDDSVTSGVLEITDSVKVKDRMTFNVTITSGA